MESRAHAIAAGVFTILLGVCVLAAFWWLTGSRQATRELVLVTTRGVSGLTLQAQVRYRGIRAGKVQAIGLNPDDPREILVSVTLPAQFPITTSTMARLSQQGLTGLGYVQIEDDGSGEPLSPVPGQPSRIALQPAAFESLTAAAGDIASHTRELVDRIEMLLSERNIARVTRTLASLEAASGGLDESLRNVPQLVADLRSTVAAIEVNRVQAVLANLERATGQAAPLIEELRGAIAPLKSTALRLDALSAEVGADVTGNTMPRVNKLIGDLSANSRQLSRVLDEVERSPQSLLLGRAPARPGPGEPGFEAQR